MKALLISVFLLGSQAYAKTAFDTLRDAFNNAHYPAKVQDFAYGTWKNCVFSDITNPHVTRNTHVRTLQYMTGPGQGPLFPGDNDYRIDVFYDYSIDQNLVSFFRSSSIEEDGVNLCQVLNGPPWRRMNIYGRTDTDMLLFHVEISHQYGHQAPMYPRVYGYCWNDSTKDDDAKDDDGSGEQPLPIPEPQ